MNCVQKKIKHLKKFGFKDSELGQIRKMYDGKEFDDKDPAYIKLLEISEHLCKSYSDLLAQEMRLRHKNKKLKISVFRYLHFYFRKLKILKKLFPIHGFILYAEDGIRAVIGLVDLKGYGFINRNVKFTPNSLVKVKKSNIFASNITVGDESLQRGQHGCKLSEIVIEKDCWICAGVKIFGNVTIGRGCVVGGGAFVENNLDENMLAVGRPSRQVRKIEDGCQSKRKAVFSFSSVQKNLIARHVEKYNNGKFPKVFEDMIDGKVFNSIDKSLGFLFRLTKWLCFEYNSADVSEERKKEILDILFVGHGKNFEVGKGLQLDMLGTVLVGDDVKIGNNVVLGGNIIMEDGVEIGDNSILFASGHSLIAKERTVRYSLRKGFYEDTQYDFIKIEKGAKVGKNVVIVPNSKVEQNVPDNALFVKGKIIK